MTYGAYLWGFCGTYGAVLGIHGATWGICGTSGQPGASGACLCACSITCLGCRYRVLQAARFEDAIAKYTQAADAVSDKTSPLYLTILNNRCECMASWAGACRGMWGLCAPRWACPVVVFVFKHRVWSTADLDLPTPPPRPTPQCCSALPHIPAVYTSSVFSVHHVFAGPPATSSRTKSAAGRYSFFRLSPGPLPGVPAVPHAASPQPRPALITTTSCASSCISYFGWSTGRLRSGVQSRLRRPQRSRCPVLRQRPAFSSVHRCWQARQPELGRPGGVHGS